MFKILTLVAMQPISQISRAQVDCACGHGSSNTLDAGIEAPVLVTANCKQQIGTYEPTGT